MENRQCSSRNMQGWDIQPTICIVKSACTAKMRSVSVLKDGWNRSWKTLDGGLCPSTEVLECAWVVSSKSRVLVQDHRANLVFRGFRIDPRVLYDHSYASKIPQY